MRGTPFWGIAGISDPINEPAATAAKHIHTLPTHPEIIDIINKIKQSVSPAAIDVGRAFCLYDDTAATAAAIPPAKSAIIPHAFVRASGSDVAVSASAVINATAAVATIPTAVPLITDFKKAVFINKSSRISLARSA